MGQRCEHNSPDDQVSLKEPNLQHISSVCTICDAKYQEVDIKAYSEDNIVKHLVTLDSRDVIFNNQQDLNKLGHEEIHSDYKRIIVESESEQHQQDT